MAKRGKSNPKRDAAFAKRDAAYDRLTRVLNPGRPDNEAGWLDEMQSLINDLSPENLACDGEASPAQVRAKRALITRRWAFLEAKLGRKVSMAGA